MKIVVIILLLLTTTSHAQVVRWSTIPDSCDMKRVYQIEIFPPIYPGMDRNIANALTMADTLAKTLSVNQLDSTLHNLSDDSLKLFLQNIKDLWLYDPLLFHILFKQKLHQYPPIYKMSYGDLIWRVRAERVRRYGRYDDTTNTLFNMDGGVYFVHINSITRRLEVGRDLFGFEEDHVTSSYWCVTATVIDKLLGQQVWPSYPGTESSDADILTLTWASEGGGGSRYLPDVPAYYRQDSAYLAEGHDYLVFVYAAFYVRESGSWIMNYGVVHRLECVNGVVKNPTMYLGMDDDEPYQLVKENLIRLINKIDN